MSNQAPAPGAGAAGSYAGQPATSPAGPPAAATTATTATGGAMSNQNLNQIVCPDSSSSFTYFRYHGIARTWPTHVCAPPSLAASLVCSQASTTSPFLQYFYHFATFRDVTLCHMRCSQFVFHTPSITILAFSLLLSKSCKVTALINTTGLLKLYHSSVLS